MTADVSTNEGNFFNEVSKVIELIRPSIELDGGDIELVSVDKKGVVSIRFQGACVGCPSVDMTLQGGIEATLKEHVQGVSLVQAVE